MSKYQFKIGDKVKYKANEHEAAINNGHDPYKVYTICNTSISTVDFEGEEFCCNISRLEHAKEATPETFDYRQALKILAENPEAKIEYCLNSINWYNTKIDDEWCICEKAVYRLKPQPKKYQWLYKTKVSGQYGTTSGKFESKEEAEKAFEGDNLIFIKPLNEETL